VRQHGIDICGVGVGLDLGAYYPRSLAVDLEQGLDNRVFDELVRLLADRRRP
jgi:cobaltochelatase CobT